MKTILLILLLSLAAVTGWLVWQNRASEKIWSNLLPALAVGTVAALLTTFFSLKQETRESEFLSTFFYEMDSKMPFAPEDHPYIDRLSERPTGTSVAYLVQEAVKAKPELGEQTGLEAGQILYLEVLTRSLLGVLFFGREKHWDVAIQSQRCEAPGLIV